MASKNKSYIQKALDKLFSAFKISKAEMSDLENLRKQALTLVKGNEEDYIGYIDQQLAEIKEKIQLKDDKETAKLAIAAQKNYGIEPTEVEVQAMERVRTSNEKMKLQRKQKKGRINGKTITTTIAGTVVTASILVGCGLADTTNENSLAKSQTNLILEKNESISTEEKPAVEIEEVEVKSAEQIAEEAMQEYVNSTVENVVEAANGMLSNGVAMINKEQSEELQKENVAKIGLQYYIVANIDDMTPEEYINFMQAEHGNVIDKDDLIYGFRTVNEMFKDQIMVSTPDNKIDFATIYENEMDAKLLNDAADIIARLNVAGNKSERQEISKEFYEYVVNTFNDDLSNFNYSNSALATFINAEFSAWVDLTKNAGFKNGAHPDDELEARVMTVISNCGKSEGEKAEVEVVDETKTSLESINVIRIIETLDSRFEVATQNYSNITLYDFASYGQMKEQVIEDIDLTKYVELESYTEKQREAVLNAKPVVHQNDSQVSNGQGGTIANSEFVEHNIDPSSPTAKEDYEAAVRQETEQRFEQETVTKNEDGVVVNRDELITWAQQGAIDANTGNYNSSVPAEYKDAYQNGYDEATAAIMQVENQLSSSTTYEEVPEQVVEQTETVEQIDFTTESFTVVAPEIVPNPVPETTPQPGPEIVVPDAPTEVTDSNYRETTFVPIDPVIQDSEEIIEETYEGFVDTANAPRTIEVQTISRSTQLQELYSLKQQLSEAANQTINNANLVLSEIEEDNKTK